MFSLPWAATTVLTSMLILLSLSFCWIFAHCARYCDSMRTSLSRTPRFRTKSNTTENWNGIRQFKNKYYDFRLFFLESEKVSLGCIISGFNFYCFSYIWRLYSITDSMLGHRSTTPGFKHWPGYVRRVFHLSLRFITFGRRSANFTYLVQKSGRETATFIFLIFAPHQWLKSCSAFTASFCLSSRVIKDETFIPSSRKQIF